MKLKIILSVLVMSVLATMLLGGSAHAINTLTTSHSWDHGLFATNSRFNDTVHSWGQRKTSGAWGTGPVNYQSGSTTNVRGNSSGSVRAVLRGTYCPGGSCSYGSGTGYKGIVQLWNDPNNYIAFGLIHDPGKSPTGTTLMIEGAGAGQPVGGYWSNNGITGTSHVFKVTWGPGGVSLNIDNQVNLGPYPVAANNPSISFLAAGRQTNDIADTTFTGISFSPGSIAQQPIYTPSGSPYLTYEATINDGGTGTGHSAYINVHDANSNALAVGIQSDTTEPVSGGNPYFIWQKVQQGVFTYDYIESATTNDEPIKLEWWSSENVAKFYKGTTPIANIEVIVQPRLFFNAEGNARKNGDSVSSTVENTQITVGDTCPTYCGLNGTWNDNDFDFFGLNAEQTNGAAQNGADFSITGTVSGVPGNGDWDTHLVAGIGMIAQFWNGQ